MHMAPKKISAVIFDVDGTLLDTERVYMEGWRQSAIRQDFRMDEEYLLKTRAMDSATAKKLFAEYYPGQDFERTRKYRVEIAEKIIEECDPEKLLKPGVLKILDWLDEHGIRKSVATGSDFSVTVSHLTKTGLIDRFPVQVTVEEVERGKPFPDIFLYTAKKLDVDPAECMVCEDSRAGIEAAYAAGMVPVFIEDCVPVNDRVREIAYRTPKTLEELPEIISEYENESYMERHELEREDMRVRGTELLEYTGKYENVVVPGYIKTICKGAFSSSYIRKVEFAKGVRKLEPYSFYNCKKLEEVVFSDSVTEIGEGAFSLCPALKKVEFSESLKSIGPMAFSGCGKLEELNIPASVIFVTKNAFSDQTQLHTVENSVSHEILAKKAEEKNRKISVFPKKEVKTTAAGNEPEPKKEKKEKKEKGKRKNHAPAIIIGLLLFLILPVFGLRAFDRPLFDALLGKIGLEVEKKADEVRGNLDEAANLESIQQELASKELETAETEPVITVENLGLQDDIPENVTEIRKVKATASKHLVSKSGYEYVADFCVDGDMSTSWQVNTDTGGTGESVEFSFEKAPLSCIRFFGGNCRSQEKFEANNRPAKITLKLSADGETAEYPVELEDKNGCQFIQISGAPVVEKVTIVIDDIYKGNYYRDTCISEVQFYRSQDE